MKRELTYLAVPYSHEDPTVREYRFLMANKAAAQLMNMGKLVYSPISHTHPIAVDNDLPNSWEYWKRMDEAFLSYSKELYILKIDGYNESKGVRAEKEYAIKNGMDIYYLEAL